MIAAELRPPRAELETAASMDAWIDTYHAVRGLTRAGHVRVPDRQRRRRKEEDNLRHLVINLGHRRAARSRVVPFLTLQALARLLPGLRRPGAAARVPVARRARRRQERRAAALRRARVAAARDDPRRTSRRSRSAAGPIRTRTPRAQVRLPLDDRRHRRVLPDADRLAPQPRRRSSGSSTKAARRGSSSRASSACSTTAAATRGRSRR